MITSSGVFQIDRRNQHFQFFNFGPPMGNFIQKIFWKYQFFDPSTLDRDIGKKGLKIDTFLAVRLLGTGTR